LHGATAGAGGSARTVARPLLDHSMAAAAARHARDRIFDTSPRFGWACGPEILANFTEKQQRLKHLMGCLGSGLSEDQLHRQLKDPRIRRRRGGHHRLLAQVRLRVGENSITAVITRDAVNALGLRRGQPAIALIKSTEVMIACEPRESRQARTPRTSRGR